MAELAASGRAVLVSPAIPTLKSRFDAYTVLKTDERTAQLRNIGSGQSVTVPLGRIIEIIWRGDNDKPEVNLNGRLQWLTLQGEWKFFPERPESQEEKQYGFGKPTNRSDPVVNQVWGELQSRGYRQLARFMPQEMQRRVNHGWDVIYDADGRYFQYQDPDKRILAALVALAGKPGTITKPR